MYLGVPTLDIFRMKETLLEERFVMLKFLK